MPESYERELETLKSYAQVMKDASETDKQDAERFHADLKKAKLELEENELPLIESKEQCDELERKTMSCRILWIGPMRPTTT